MTTCTCHVERWPSVDVTSAVKRHERGRTVRQEILKISLDKTLYKKILKWVKQVLPTLNDALDRESVDYIQMITNSLIQDLQYTY